MTDLGLTATQAAALDNPIWSSLTTAHRELAKGDETVLRYPAEIAPFAAFAQARSRATEDLRALAKDGPVVLFTPAPVAPIEGLEVQLQAPLRQMVSVEAPTAFHAAFDTLGAADVPAMLELTALTKPGPFFPRTRELGQYVGVRDDGRLVAMAGERMRFDGFTEISAVCVHPDYRGRGYAQLLIKALMKAIADRGEISFLHVFDSNRNAIALYESLGFAARTALQVTALQRGAMSPVVA
jgi:predicted GNAT family acetyltransferase